jgi:hypothetical protein
MAVPRKFPATMSRLLNRRIESFLIDLASELGIMRRNIMEKNTSHHRVSCPGAPEELHLLEQRSSIIEREEATLGEN